MVRPPRIFRRVTRACWMSTTQAFAEDQHSVGVFAAGGAHPAFAFARGACGGVLMILMPAEVNTSSKLAVDLVSRSRMSNLRRSARSSMSMTRFRACWTTHGAVRVGREAGEVDSAAGDLDEEQHVDPLEEIHTLNPRTPVLGGPLSELYDEILSGVRAAVYEKALPLATRKLIITLSQLGTDAGTTGAIALACREIFNISGLGRLLAET